MSYVSRLVLSLLTLALASGPALAGQFNVSPTRIDLSGPRPSTLVTIHNTGEQPLRFQVSAWSWSQTATSDLDLEPTEDLLVYPSLLEVAPGGTRRVRIGTLIAPSDTEQSYRVFVEELPPLGDSGPGVHVLTRASLPAFLLAAHPAPHVTIGDPSFAEKTLAFDAVSDGNAHVMLQQLRIEGRDGDGQPVFIQNRRGWYLLAGHRQTIEVSLVDATCRGLRTLTIEAETDVGTWDRTVEIEPGMCDGL